jgi:hypothetical protein
MNLAFLFRLALVAFALEQLAGQHGGPRARRHARVGHVHHLVGDAIRFML